MKLDNKIFNYLRYIDQGFYSLSTLLLSLLAPVFFSTEISAEILYLISFFLLFLAIVTAIFVTQMLSIHDENNEVSEKIFRLFILFVFIIFTVTYIWQFFVGIKNPFFFYFSYLFCIIEFIRRLFIKQGEEVWSLCISIACLIFIPSSYYFASLRGGGLWKILSFSMVIIVLPTLYLYFVRFHCQVNYDRRFIRSFFKNGLLALFSFGLVWVATQGVFVVFYENVGSKEFVQQKLMFSILGFFSIIMLVQENKYQPLYSSAISRKDLALLKKFDRAVGVESHLLFILCIVLTLIFFITGFDFYLSFLLFSVYRYILGFSKKYIYYLRAEGDYIHIALSNLYSLIILGIVYVIFFERIDTKYIIPVFFIIQVSTFLFMISFYKLRSIHEKYRNI